MINLTVKIPILGNRDGNLFIAKSTDGSCFLILESDTFHNKPTFQGMSSTEHIQISIIAFDSLTHETRLLTTKPTHPRMDQNRTHNLRHL